MRIAAKIAYDGSHFFGFSRQKGVVSVTQALEKALKMVGITVRILAAGRTDRGVHATGQVIVFDIPEFWDLERLRIQLNFKLYPSIFIKRIWRVCDEFHPRFWAKMREYRFIFSHFSPAIWLHSYISRERLGKGFKIDFSSLDLEYLTKILRLFEGEHDFSFFCKSNGDSRDFVRTIYRIRLYPYRILNEDCLVATFLANGFLYSQIRLMMGATLACLRKEITFEEIKLQLLCQKKYFSTPALPNGLYLTRVIY